MYKYNLKKDSSDLRDHLFARPLLLESLPKEIDLRVGCSPVVNQGELGSCTANAMGSGLREYMLKKDNKWQPMSRLFLYYMERLAEGNVKQDSGASIRTGMKILASGGICEESYMPYVIKDFTKQPSKAAISNAVKYKVSLYQRLNTLYDMKRCLYEGYPLVAGIIVYESFESENAAKTGTIPLPADTEKELGGHAICIVGYKQTGDSDNDGYFIVRNSWGAEWGDKGYCYIPFEFLDKQLMFDCWTAR